MNRSKQKEKLKENRLRAYKDVDELKGMFRNYAVSKMGVTPLIPRHMTPELWRQLYWLDPHLVVVHGREYRSLCSLCLDKFLCAGKVGQATFECQTNADKLELRP